MTGTAAAFRALHVPGDPFVLVNAWDAGSAKVLAALGAQAIGTTSGGHAFTLGRPDLGNVSRDEGLTHASALAEAVDVPVSADLEDGFGADPGVVAETVHAAAATGIAGLSIEDVDHAGGGGPHEHDAAVARVAAAVEASRACKADVLVLARADGVMHRAYDLDEAIRRVKAFERAGADAVYVPVPGDRAAQQRVVDAVDVPVNALAVGRLAGLTRNDFAEMGVARISVGASLARMTQRVLVDAGRAMVEGRFDSHEPIGRELDRLLTA